MRLCTQQELIPVSEIRPIIHMDSTGFVDPSDNSLLLHRTSVLQHSVSYKSLYNNDLHNIIPSKKRPIRPIPRLTEQQKAKFWSKVDKQSSIAGCWLWLGSTTWRRQSTLRYGVWKTSNQQMRPHRVAYTLLVGEIPEGLTLDHSCHNTLCVNPDHLTPMTLEENIARRRDSSVPHIYR